MQRRRQQDLPRSGTPWLDRGGLWSHGAWIACPAVLWVFASYFLLGDWGKFLDDYHYGLAPHGAEPTRYTWLFPFWFRPLQRIVQPALQTLLWDMDWLHHALSAGIMGANGVLVATLVRRAGFSRHAALVAACLYLFAPSMGELIFWSACIPTLLSIFCVLWAMICAQGLVLSDLAARWWLVPAITLLVFASACLNEQASSYLCAAWLIVWATAIRRGVSRRVWREAAAATAAMGVAAAGYVLLQRSTMPAHWPGSPDHYVTLSEAPARAWYVLGSLSRVVALKNLAQPSLPLAWKAISEHPARACIFGVLIVASGVLVRTRASREAPQRCIGRCARGDLIMLAAAVTIVFCSLLPVIAMRGYRLSFRMTHGYVLGIAIAGAVATSRLEQVSWGAARQRRLREIGATTLVVLSAGAGVLLVGQQGLYRARWLGDQRIGRSLVYAFPDLPLCATLLPLENEEELATGDPALDDMFMNAMRTPWGARGFVRMQYGRMDLEARWREYGLWRGYREPGPDGMSIDPPVDTWYWPDGPPVAPTWLYPWSHIAAFIVDGEGNVARISEIRHFQNGEWKTYDLPLGSGGIPYIWTGGISPVLP